MANTDWKELIRENNEKRFDYRLIEKKIEEGFMTREEAEKYLKSISEEAEVDFTSHDDLMSDDLATDSAS